MERRLEVLVQDALDDPPNERGIREEGGRVAIGDPPAGPTQTGHPREATRLDFQELCPGNLPHLVRAKVPVGKLRLMLRPDRRCIGAEKWEQGRLDLVER